jgi:hypothetical protein
VADPKNPALPRMRDWPTFRHPAGRRQHKNAAQDGRAPPPVSELIMAHVRGTPAQKLAWLQEQKAAGKLDGDDPEEIEQAEALLLMLIRISDAKGRTAERRLDELLDEGLKETFPASDPVSVGHFTSTEPPGRPIDRTVVDFGASRKAKSRTAQRSRIRPHG